MISNLLLSGLSFAASFGSILSLLTNIGNFFLTLFYWISLAINSVIYSAAATSYTLFPIMADLNLENLSAVIQNIVIRIETFIGVFMLFVVAFNLLQYLVDPDKKEGATSNLIKKIIISIILLVSSSFVFSLLGDLQNAIIKDRIVERIVFGNDQQENLDYNTQGKSVAYAAFFSMYRNTCQTTNYPTDDYTAIMTNDKDLGYAMGHLWETALALKNKSLSECVTYRYPFLADVIGIFLIILFFTFALDIGVRNFTLLFLRTIFPIAAIGYISPKGEGILQKYISEYVSVYVQVFIKTFIIYILIYILSWFMQVLGTEDIGLFKNVGEVSDVTKILVLGMVLVALFMFFTKGLPAIMKNVFGIESNSSLGGLFGKALGIATAGLSMATAGIGGLIGGGVGAGAKGALKGAVRGATAGAKAGYNFGKGVGSGQIGKATVGYGRGMAGAFSGISNSNKQTLKDMENKAKEDEQSYIDSKDELKKEKDKLALMQKNGASQAEISAQQSKISNLETRTNRLKDKAQKSAAVIRKHNPDYASKAEQTAVQAEKDATGKTAQARQAQSIADAKNAKAVEAEANAKRLLASNDPTASAAVINAQALRRDADAASDNAIALNSAAITATNNAKSLAQEAKLWNPDYDSALLTSTSGSTESRSDTGSSRAIDGGIARDLSGERNLSFSNSNSIEDVATYLDSRRAQGIETTAVKDGVKFDASMTHDEIVSKYNNAMTKTREAGIQFEQAKDGEYITSQTITTDSISSIDNLTSQLGICKDAGMEAKGIWRGMSFNTDMTSAQITGKYNNAMNRIDASGIKFEPISNGTNVSSRIINTSNIGSIAELAGQFEVCKNVDMAATGEWNGVKFASGMSGNQVIESYLSSTAGVKFMPLANGATMTTSRVIDTKNVSFDDLASQVKTCGENGIVASGAINGVMIDSNMSSEQISRVRNTYNNFDKVSEQLHLSYEDSQISDPTAPRQLKVQSNISESEASSILTRCASNGIYASIKMPNGEVLTSKDYKSSNRRKREERRNAEEIQKSIDAANEKMKSAADRLREAENIEMNPEDVETVMNKGIDEDYIDEMDDKDDDSGVPI